MEANETFDKVVCTEEERESFACHEETDSEDVPQSLLSYFESSKSRAADCEKLILEELEDFTASHHNEDPMSSPREQVVCECSTSTDARLLPAPAETELLTHHVALRPNNEDEYEESEEHRESEHEAERQKRLCEEMKKEEQKRQTERDFQTELRKIMEAEKLQQKELELMGKRAQEQLEQELLLQQELISDLQRQVEEERRRMREEEQKRRKDEEDKRTREEEKIKIEAERKGIEEEMRRKDEKDKRMREEEKIKMEAERKGMEEEMRRKKEEQKRRTDEEDKRTREEEKIKIEAERKRMEEEMRRKKEEQKRRTDEEDKRTREEEKIKIEAERKRMEEEMRRKDEEDKRTREEEKIKMEAERKGMEEEMRRKKEEQKRRKDEEDKRTREEEKIKMEAERKRMEEEIRRKKEEERKIEEMKLKKEEERKREEEEKRRVEREEKRKREEERNKIEMEKKKLEEKMRMMKEEEERKTKEEEEKKRGEEERKKIEEEAKKKVEKEKRKMEEDINQKEEEKKKREEENMRIEEEVRIMKERKKQEEMSKKKEEEEALKKMHEEMRKRNEKQHGNVDEEAKLKESRQKDKQDRIRREELTEVVRKKEEEDRETKEEPRPIEEDEERKREDGRKHGEAEEELKEEEVGEDKKEVNRDTEKKASKQRVMCENNRTSSRTGPLHSESTISRTGTEVKPQQRDPEENISQTSVDETVDHEDQAARPVFSSLCLPEHTEEKRLAWMKDCVPWSKLSLQNRSKQQRGSDRSRRGPRAAAGSSGLPPLCPDSLLQATGCKSLQEVTAVTLEDLPGRGLSTLAQCSQLRSLTLRRCGLKSLEGISQLPQLCHMDVQENDISSVDCEDMSSLRVLRLGHNKLTSMRGLTGAENVDVLDLSHNSITRIADLKSMRRLQRLSVDHNQLISTKGLRDVCTLLHLSCSHNHLASVEGLENSALLNTLDLRANSLTEPPSLTNQVLLRELHLDDNSISSLQGLAACWLPLMQHLSVAQNRITQLPPMSDSVSLANLDLRFNCMSELQNVCESLEGCVFLREVHLTGNPLQQESGWRSTLQRAVPGLRAVDDQQTDSFLTPPAARRVGPSSGGFLGFCWAQLQQTLGLQQRHSRELSGASSSLDAVKISCRHLAEMLQLAEDQRFAHEYGDTTVADARGAAGRTTTPEEVDGTRAEKRTERPEMESAGKVPPVLQTGRSYRSRHDTFDPVGPKTGPTVAKANSGRVHSSATKMKTTSSSLEVGPVSNSQDLDLQNTAAVVIQQLWKKYRQKCGNISSLSTAEKGGGGGGDGGKPESGPSYVNGSVVDPDYAATVIQAFWRGFALRRRLASALAAVTRPDAGEDDAFEEVDVDEFAFDEAALEKPWTLSFSEDLPPTRYPASEQPLMSLKPPGHLPEPSQCNLPSAPVWRPKQAWLPGEQVDSAGQRVSPESSNSSKSPAPTPVLSGLSERSEKILEEWGFTDSHTALLMLKRAQNMKSKTQWQMKRRDPSVRLALRNCSYPLGPVAARNRPAQHNRSDIKGREAEPGLQRAEKVARARRWLRTQAAHPDRRDAESVHFLPEISSDVLNGGRVQLVADPGYTARPRHAGGSRADDSSAARPCKEPDYYPRTSSSGPARNEAPPPRRVASAPSKRERISHRDNPVQWSAGWGGGARRGTK